MGFFKDIRRDVAAEVERRSQARAVAQPQPQLTGPPEDVPPRPAGTSIRAWMPQTSQYEVAGEFYRQLAVWKLFEAQGALTAEGVELNRPAVLVPDPRNPHDRRAVAVYVDGYHVGYLEREDAAELHAPLADLAHGDEVLEVESRQWARFEPERVYARVSLSIPDVHGVKPANALPAAPWTCLPHGAAIQVTKEEQHMDVLRSFLGPHERTAVAVTLHGLRHARARSEVDLVEVRLSGQRIGELSSATSAHVLPLVNFVNERGQVAVAKAVLRGNQLKADVALYSARATDVTDEWLAGLGPALAAPPPPVSRTPPPAIH